MQVFLQIAAVSLQTDGSGRLVLSNGKFPLTAASLCLGYYLTWSVHVLKATVGPSSAAD